MKKSIHKFILFILLVVFIFATIGTSLYYKNFLLYKTNVILSTFAKTKITSNNNQTLFCPHEKFGFITTPGKYEFIFSNPFCKNQIKNTATINSEGYRYTLADSNQYKKHIWLFGDSFNWGWSVDDQETISFLLQQEIKDYKIHNYAIPGYGTIHALLQLKTFIAKKPLPEVAFFMYSPFHNIRNIAAPSRLRQIEVLSYLLCPAASLENNQLQIKMVPIKLNDSLPEPSAKYTENVTAEIFTAIYKICKTNHITPVLCLQDGSTKNTVVKHCIDLGFTVIDMSFGLDLPKMNNLPFDHHPSAYAQREYKNALMRFLKKN